MYSALEQLDKSIEQNPNSPNLHAIRGLIYLEQNRTSESLEEMKKEVSISKSSWSNGLLGYVYAKSGNQMESKRIVKLLENQYFTQEKIRENKLSVDNSDGATILSKENVIGLGVAFVYVGMKEPEKALSWLEKDFKSRNAILSYISWMPIFKDLYKNQRFIKLLGQMQLKER